MRFFSCERLTNLLISKSNRMKYFLISIRRLNDDFRIFFFFSCNRLVNFVVIFYFYRLTNFAGEKDVVKHWHVGFSWFNRWMNFADFACDQLTNFITLSCKMLVNFYIFSQDFLAKLTSYFFFFFMKSMNDLSVFSITNFRIMHLFLHGRLTNFMILFTNDEIYIYFP